jgi:RNA polymerase sigma-70 factor (ECF subfamily)
VGEDAGVDDEEPRRVGSDGARLAAYSDTFDSFYRAAYGRVVALAHSMTGDRHLAEEIAQEAFIAAHRNWDKVRRLERPDLWVRRVAINRCTSTFRRKLIEWRSNRAAHDATPDAVDGPAPDDGNAVWAAVRRLPDRQRSIVALHYVDGLTTADIGALLDLSPSTVQTHLGRARERLAELLGDPNEPTTKNQGDRS